MKLLIYLTAFCIFCVSANFVLAAESQTFTYSPTVVQEKQLTTLNFLQQSNEPLKSVLVHISSGREEIYDGRLYAKNNEAHMTFLFPFAGRFTVHTQFDSQTGTTEKDFYLDVAANQHTLAKWLVTIVIILSLVWLLGWLREKLIVYLTIGER